MIQESVIISLAEVRNKVDASRFGSFLASIDYLGNLERRVHYVSPYASNGEGAFVAIPEEGTQILVCKPHGSDAWYYLGSTFLAEPEKVAGSIIPDAGLYPMDRVEPEMYKARGFPMKYLFRSPSQAGLTISEDFSPLYINKYTQLKSTQNKTIRLNDSPAIDSIIINSGNGSKITLTDNPQNQSLPAQAIQVESVGPQKYINLESQTDLLVGQDGRELQLLNNANGVKWGSGATCGNVNVQSKWKDVNIFTQAEQGRIFIECLNENGSNQHIILETNGSDGSIVIKTKGKVVIDATQSVNINTGGDLNVKCKKFSVDCQSVDVASTGPVNIDGSLINLAMGAAPNSVDTASQSSTYGNTGITTY